METVYIPFDSQRRLIELSRRTLENFVRGVEWQPDQTEDPYLLTSEYGAFVSLHRGGELRGCIGTCFPSRSLAETIIEMTGAAASRDYRVPPIRQSEVSEIQISISILSPLELVHDPLSLRVGEHGLHIACGDKRGVLLPQVATEHGWDIRTFLDQTCLKAGLPEDAWNWPETKISSFTALVIEEDR
ncbi:MAG: AmmeMemoRadiSam system protein A [Candidatus Binatia bacterium]